MNEELEGVFGREQKNKKIKKGKITNKDKEMRSKRIVKNIKGERWGSVFR